MSKLNTNDLCMNDLFEMVPAVGKADTLAGEMLRAGMRIEHRWYNDGDRPGEGYGNETCNAPMRYLWEAIDTGEALGLDLGRLNRTLCALWPQPHGRLTDAGYEEALEEMMDALACALLAAPVLIETPEERDMWDFIEPDDKDW